MADEYLIAHDYMDKHYLSLSSFWSSMVHNTVSLTPLPELVMKTVAVSVGPMVSYLTGDFLDFKQKLSGPMDSLLTLNRLFDSSDILSIQELNRIYDTAWQSPKEAFEIIQQDIASIAANPFLTNIAGSILCGLASVGIDQASIHVLGDMGKQNFGRTLLYQSQGMTQIKDISMKGLKVAGLMAGKEVVKYGVQLAQKAIVSNQTTLVSNKSTDLLLKGNNGQKIAHAENGREIQQNLIDDINLLASESTQVLQKSMSELAYALMSFHPLQQLAPEALACFLPTLIIGQLWQAPIAAQYKTLEKSLAKAKLTTRDIETDIANNIEAIKLRDGDNFAHKAYDAVLSKKQEVEAALADLNIEKSISTEGLLTLGFVMDALYLPYKYIADGMSSAALYGVHSYLKAAYGFFNSPMALNLNNQALIRSQERVGELMNILNTSEVRHAQHATHEASSIIFDSYQLKLDDHIIVSMPHLELALGENYLITGPSGQGKTSTLIDLKQGVMGALSSTGTILLPIVEGHVAKVVFIDQKLYLPPQATLLETLYYPSILTTENKAGIREQVIEFMQALDMDEFIHDTAASQGLLSRLDSASFKLSGGQAKKTAFIQAFFAEPDILILDESFTGLDAQSLTKVQSFLTTYLPKATILSVDHEGNHHNDSHFYDIELHFEGGSVNQAPLSPFVLDNNGVIATNVSDESSWDPVCDYLPPESTILFPDMDMMC